MFQDIKKTMLNTKILNECSLIHGNKKNALTFIIKLNTEGKIIDIDFKKSIINVNYNLTKSYAEWFYKNSFDKNLKDALSLARKYALILRKNRKLSLNKVSMSSAIIEEYNILLDVAVADFFKKCDKIFAYKNYLGKYNKNASIDLSACYAFNSFEKLSKEGTDLLYSIDEIYNRVFYDTISYGNVSLNKDVGNVGNPLREYISLETDRLIKDLIIDKLNNYYYWEERIERDCLEYTEKSAKIKSLYNRKY